jgi:hypothetical protein
MFAQQKNIESKKIDSHRPNKNTKSGNWHFSHQPESQPYKRPKMLNLRLFRLTLEYRAISATGTR